MLNVNICTGYGAQIKIEKEFSEILQTGMKNRIEKKTIFLFII